MSGNQNSWWVVGWYKEMLKVSEWDVESAARASPAFLIPAKSQQAGPAGKVVLNSIRARLGFPPFLPGIANVDLFPVFHRNLLWHFWGHRAQNEAITQRGSAVSASSASCFWKLLG